MKKLHIAIALVLWGFAQSATAQNMYRNYLSNCVSRPKSAVSVVHSNGYVYFFQADDMGKLSVSEIDPLSFSPTGNDTAYQITTQTIPNIEFHLCGGFEDVNGEFVLFGDIRYYDNNTYYQYPAYGRVDPNLSSCSIYYDINIPGSFTAGCDGFDQNVGDVYVFVNGRNLSIVEAASPVNLQTLMLDLTANPYDYFTDISWDAFHNKFIATGTAFNFQPLYHYPFVSVFELSGYNANFLAEYVLDYTTNDNSSDLKSLHTQLDGDNLILYHDRRVSVQPNYSYDIIWLSRINVFWNINTASISESWFFELPNNKLLAKDMIYDSYYNRLNFLGFFNGHTHLLAQIDPYMMASGIEIGQLGASFLGGMDTNNQPPIVYIANNSLEMFNLALNRYNPCYPLLMAGVCDKGSILTETYDISTSFCDKPIWHSDSKVNPKLTPYSLYFSQPSPNIQHPLITILSNNVAVTILCDEDIACSHQFGGKSAQFSLTDGKNVADITIEGSNSFVCDGFEGDILYYIYDMAGKVLQQGVTRNGEWNKVKKSNGIYLLQAIDFMGNKVVKKIVLL